MTWYCCNSCQLRYTSQKRSCLITPGWHPIHQSGNFILQLTILKSLRKYGRWQEGSPASWFQAWPPWCSSVNQIIFRGKVMVYRGWGCPECVVFPQNTLKQLIFHVTLPFSSGLWVQLPHLKGHKILWLNSHFCPMNFDSHPTFNIYQVLLHFVVQGQTSCYSRDLLTPYFCVPMMKRTFF